MEGLLSPKLSPPSSASLAVERKSGPVLWLRGLAVQARLVALLVRSGRCRLQAFGLMFWLTRKQ